MNTRKISLLIATGLFAVFGTTANAEDKWLGNRGDNWESHIKSTKTRAQVQGELNEAHVKGEHTYGQEPTYPATPVVKSTLTREQVRSDMREAVREPERTMDYSSGQ